MRKGRLSKRCLKEVIGMDDRMVMLIGIPVLAFFIPLIFFDATLENGLLDESSEISKRYSNRCDKTKIPCFSVWTENHKPSLPAVN